MKSSWIGLPSASEDAALEIAAPSARVSRRAILSSVPKRLALVAPHPRRVARRLRTVGVLAIAAGVVAAGGMYWFETYRAGPTIEDLLPGTRAANARQIGLLYGHGVESLWEVYQELKEPAGQAMTVIAISGLVAAGCFRAAWLREHGESGF